MVPMGSTVQGWRFKPSDNNYKEVDVKLLLVVLLSLISVVQAEIIYMKGAVTPGTLTPTYNEPILYLDLDAQMSSEIIEGAEFYYIDNSVSSYPNDRIIGVAGWATTYINGPYEVGKSTSDIVGWYGYNATPDPSYHALRIRASITATDWHYGWLKWDGGTYAEYAFESTPNVPIEIGAIPEANSIVLIGLVSGCAVVVRRRFII